MNTHVLVSDDGGESWLIQRRYARGVPHIVHWCGRCFGWAFTGDYYAPRPKRYAQKQNAKAALKRILAHERELGLTDVRYGRTL